MSSAFLKNRKFDRIPGSNFDRAPTNGTLNAENQDMLIEDPYNKRASIPKTPRKGVFQGKDSISTLIFMRKIINSEDVGEKKLISSQVKAVGLTVSFTQENVSGPWIKHTKW